MKIDYAIMSSNDNPMYFDFWEPVSKCWEKLGITPLLFYFGNKNINDSRVIKVKPLEKYQEAIQLLWIRYFAPKVLDQNKVSIISDIDMIPLSKNYFCESISNFTEDTYVHLNPCIETYGRYPSCYHVAQNKKFVEILELDRFSSFEDSVKECLKYSQKNYSSGWFADENFASEMLKKNINKNVKLLKRLGGQNGHRIDRATNDLWCKPFELSQISQQAYYDCHSIRPYKNHKQQIDSIIFNFLNGKYE